MCPTPVYSEFFAKFFRQIFLGTVSGKKWWSQSFFWKIQILPIYSKNGKNEVSDVFLKELLWAFTLSESKWKFIKVYWFPAQPAYLAKFLFSSSSPKYSQPIKFLDYVISNNVSWNNWYISSNWYIIYLKYLMHHIPIRFSILAWTWLDMSRHA